MFEPGHLTERRPPFRFAAYTRVAFSDTDAQGVVYYGRYLPYFDLARTEYHRQLGEIGASRAEFVMRASSVEYHAPARFDDLLEVFVRVARIGRTSVTYEYAAHRLEPERRGTADGDGDADARPDRPRRPADASRCRTASATQSPRSRGPSCERAARSRRSSAIVEQRRRRRRRPARRGRGARRARRLRAGPGSSSSRAASSSSAREAGTPRAGGRDPRPGRLRGRPASPSSPPTAATDAALLERRRRR